MALLGEQEGKTKDKMERLFEEWYGDDGSDRQEHQKQKYVEYGPHGSNPTHKWNKLEEEAPCPPWYSE